MEQKIYAIYDSKMEAYLQPIFARNNGEALRMFATAVNTEGGNFQTHAPDYTLMQIGKWEDTTAQITDETNVNLGNGLEFKQTQDYSPPGLNNIALNVVDPVMPELQHKGNGAVQGGE